MNIDQSLEYLIMNSCFLCSLNINTILQNQMYSDAPYVLRGISGFCHSKTSESLYAE